MLTRKGPATTAAREAAFLSNVTEYKTEAT